MNRLPSPQCRSDLNPLLTRWSNARHLPDPQIHRLRPPKADEVRSERGARRGEQDLDPCAREPAVPGRRQVELAVGRHVDRVRALSRDHLRFGGAHPPGVGELKRGEGEFFAGRDDGDVGTREPLEVSGLCGDGDCAGDPSSQDLRHHLCIANKNVRVAGDRTLLSHARSGG